MKAKWISRVSLGLNWVFLYRVCHGWLPLGYWIKLYLLSGCNDWCRYLFLGTNWTWRFSYERKWISRVSLGLYWVFLYRVCHGWLPLGYWIKLYLLSGCNDWCRYLFLGTNWTWRFSYERKWISRVSLGLYWVFLYRVWSWVAAIGPHTLTHPHISFHKQLTSPICC